MDISTLASKIQLCYSTTELTQVETSLTMTSREIAELTGVRHDNAKRTLQTLVENGIIVQPQAEDEQFQDSLGRSRTERSYRLDERAALILTARLSPEFTAKIVDQWIEFRSLIRTQQLLIEKQAEEKAALISEKLKIAREAEDRADRKFRASRDLLEVVKPSHLPKLVKADPEWRDRCIKTLDSFLSDPKLSTYYAGEHDNAVKECVNVQDRLKAVLQFANAHLRLKPESSGHKLPDCTEALSYRRNLLT